MEHDTNIQAFNIIVGALKDLDAESQKRTIQSIITILNISINDSLISYNPNVQNTDNAKNSREVLFSENRDISPKEFMRDKSPQTDTERIACLAYYLTIYRAQPHFKTIDLSTLNTEAAQPKMSNPTVATDNATKVGLLVQATKGSKQISSAGELFVQALPDRELAKASIAGLRIKRKRKPQSKNTTKTETN